MGKVRWKLRQVIKQHGLRPRDVENMAIELGYKFGRNTIYRLIREDGPANVNRDTLAALIHALRELTGELVTVKDLLEFVLEN